LEKAAARVAPTAIRSDLGFDYQCDLQFLHPHLIESEYLYIVFIAFEYFGNTIAIKATAGCFQMTFQWFMDRDQSGVHSA